MFLSRGNHRYPREQTQKIPLQKRDDPLWKIQINIQGQQVFWRGGTFKQLDAQAAKMSDNDANLGAGQHKKNNYNDTSEAMKK